VKLIVFSVCVHDSSGQGKSGWRVVIAAFTPPVYPRFQSHPLKRRFFYFLTALACASVAGSSCLEAADFYVAPKGDDSSAGTRDQPFATLERAQRAVRDARVGHPEEPVTVWVRGGEYVIDQPLSLTAADSGTEKAPVTYRAVDGEQPVFLNARPLKAEDFRAITDPATLARIPEALRGKIVALDLKALGLAPLKAPPAVYTDAGGLPDLYCDGRRLALSRYPGQGFMTMKRVLVNGNAHGTAGVFEYREQDYPVFEALQKIEDRGLWLKGYWRVMWENEALKIKSIDTGAHTVTFEQGIASGIGSKYHRPEGDGREEYWLLNLLEETNAPGEWCIDYPDQTIYLYPPDDLRKIRLYLGISSEPTLALDNVSHVIIRGLTFEYGLGEAIRIKGGDHVLIAGCTVTDVDKYAIRVDGGFADTVLSCDLSDLGAGGVWLAGGDDTTTPRKPAGHRVINNHIHHFSEIEKVYTPAVNCGYAGGTAHYPCVGCLVAHNLIHDTPHGGICYGSWDNVFEYNEIFRYCLTSNDLGAFYSYGRYDVMGNETFRYNLIHDSAQGDGIYFDWDHRDMHVHGNIIDLKSSGAKGCGLLYKVGTQTDKQFASDPADRQRIDCHDNVVVHCKIGGQFFIPERPTSRIENNVAIECVTPWNVATIAGGKASKVSASALSSSNRSYQENPGFADIARLDFGLKPDAQLLRDVPGFQPIPVTQIGLYADEYRKSLPSDEEIDRLCTHTSIGGAAYGIEDRK
jgi:hypothetical protein